MANSRNAKGYEAFRRARRLEHPGELVIVAPPEYVIVRKLEYHRQGGSGKHLRDIRAMMAVSRSQLDRAEIHRRGFDKEWRSTIG